MNQNVSKLVDFVNKTFSIKQNAVYKAQDFANLLSQATGYQTYIETAKSENTVDADTLHYRIQKDATLDLLLGGFKKISKNIWNNPLLNIFRNESVPGRRFYCFCGFFFPCDNCRGTDVITSEYGRIHAAEV